MSAPTELCHDIFARSMDTMLDPSVSNKSIRSTERLFVSTNLAPRFSLERIVDCILVTGEIIRSGEHCVAWLPSGWVRSHTSVWTWLSISRSDGGSSRNAVGSWSRLSVSLSSMLLQLARCGEPLSASRECACICSSISSCILWSLYPTIHRVMAWNILVRIGVHVGSSIVTATELVHSSVSEPIKM